MYLYLYDTILKNILIYNMNMVYKLKIIVDFIILSLWSYGYFLKDLSVFDNAALAILCFSLLVVVVFGYTMVQSDQRSIAIKKQLLPKSIKMYIYTLIVFNLFFALLLYFEYYKIAFIHANSGIVFLFAMSRIKEINTYLDK